VNSSLEPNDLAYMWHTADAVESCNVVKLQPSVTDAVSVQKVSLCRTNLSWNTRSHNAFKA
jgi:hypothetical protein